MIEIIIQTLSSARFPIDNEKQTQEAIANILLQKNIEYIREFHLDEKNIPDFFILNGEIAIEIKIKGKAMKIYKQCERYCKSDQVKQLILITNRSMGFPKEINGKPCYVINIGRAWL